MTDQALLDEIAALRLAGAQRQIEVVAATLIERKICEVWGISYMADGSHWEGLNSLRDDMRDMRRRFHELEEHKTTIWRSVREKIVSIAIGAAVALGASYFQRHNIGPPS